MNHVKAHQQEIKGKFHWISQCPSCGADNLHKTVSDGDAELVTCHRQRCSADFLVSMGFHCVFDVFGNWRLTTYGLEYAETEGGRFHGYYTIDKRRLHESNWWDHVASKSWCDPQDFADALNAARRKYLSREHPIELVSRADVAKMIKLKQREEKLDDYVRTRLGKKEGDFYVVSFGDLERFSKDFDKEHPMVGEKSKVKLFRDNDRFGVQTTAINADEFLASLAETIGALISSGYMDSQPELVLSRWLPQAFEIASKLRGYKADVQEERVLYAGAAFVSDSAAVSIPVPEVKV